MAATDRDDPASRRQVIAGLAVGVALGGAGGIRAASPEGIAANVEAIHPEVTFKAPPSTLLKCDQTGFPSDDAENLARGWKMNYWQPMAKVLTHL
ncbi:MAG TPA: hypothetical protein VGV09_06090 [Steroidobacteraceae bacterium]|nr:hypothetical protein [Steroidobacteraceae bacterium]